MWWHREKIQYRHRITEFRRHENQDQVTNTSPVGAWLTCPGYRDIKSLHWDIERLLKKEIVGEALWGVPSCALKSWLCTGRGSYRGVGYVAVLTPSPLWSHNWHTGQSSLTLFILNPDSYISGDFRISPCWLRCSLDNSLPSIPSEAK